MTNAPSPDRQTSCSPRFSIRLASAALGTILLAGCSTTKETANVAPTETAEDASGILAKGARTGSGRYVDPMISTARGQQARTAASPQGQPAAAAQSNTFPEQPSSIAGMTTEPTGVRAGNFSIFSSAQPQAAAPPGNQPNSIVPSPDATATVPTDRGVSAARRSVFSSAPAPAPQNCGADAQGNALSC